jgi:EpsI family protein
MAPMSVATRAGIVAVSLLGAGAYLARAARAEPVHARESLAMCPTDIATWSGRRAADFDARTLGVLGVDEYLSRVYTNAAGRRVALYIGYYGSQRQGDTMHSPLNCLPGAGWAPVSFDRIRVPVETNQASAEIEINRYVIEKGLDRQVVLYWYQSHGRVVASEIWGKVFLVLDAIRTNRTDGALVRVIAPVASSEPAAERDAVEFVRVLYPLLGRYLPS